MDERTPDPPFPDACRTKRCFITPCCTAGTHEFLVDGAYYLAFQVAGHGWSPAWPGRIDDINDTGTLVDADGTERKIYWRAGRDAGTAAGPLQLHPGTKT